MRRYAAPPVHLLEQPRVNLGDNEPRYAYRYQPPTSDGSFTEPESHISLLFWPAGFNKPWATLKTSSYVCDADRIAEGQGSMSSSEGALFVRWTKQAERVWRVAPQV